VLFHRAEGDHELFGNGRVRRARGQQRQDFQLAGRSAAQPGPALLEQRLACAPGRRAGEPP
jgi:hypothetical protein